MVYLVLGLVSAIGLYIAWAAAQEAKAIKDKNSTL